MWINGLQLDTGSEIKKKRKSPYPTVEVYPGPAGPYSSCSREDFVIRKYFREFFATDQDFSIKLRFRDLKTLQWGWKVASALWCLADCICGYKEKVTPILNRCKQSLKKGVIDSVEEITQVSNDLWQCDCLFSSYAAYPLSFDLTPRQSLFKKIVVPREFVTHQERGKMWKRPCSKSPKAPDHLKYQSSTYVIREYGGKFFIAINKSDPLGPVLDCIFLQHRSHAEGEKCEFTVYNPSGYEMAPLRIV
jgi:hypothetical protein